MKIFKKTINILLTILVLAILPIVVLTLISSKTSALYGIQSFVVLTGSMEPNLSTGSVIYTRPNQNYSKGDIIAFKNGDRTITHRIASVKGINTYVTKGDANNAADSEAVTKDKIIGKELFAIPYIGYFIRFLSTLQSFLLFIAAPIILFIGFELWNIKKEMERHIEAKLMKKMKVTQNLSLRGEIEAI